MTVPHKSDTANNVIKIQRQAAPKKSRKTKARKTRPAHTIAASGILVVGLILVGLSLSHLAEGVQIVTGSGTATSWSMAAGIDLGFVALEIAMLVTKGDIRAEISRYASPAIVGTLAISAAMNAFAFASKAEGFMILPASALGCAIPALIYALTKTGAALAFHRR